MSPPAIPLRRRLRSEFELSQDDGDSDENGRPGLSDSSSSKRARSLEDALSSPSESPEPPFQREYRRRPVARVGDTNDDQIVSSRPFQTAKDQYQPGAIVRIKVTNFVTYEKASFHPGPNLNMVIGPNGTGKSSLVCAICLGLGYSPAHLGRAQKVGEFVKHGSDHATIEVELQARHEDEQNHVVKVRIIRDGDKRKWWINNNEASLKTVQTLTRELGIQVDNLCQFLPQDRVAEFAGLNPVELLHHTQRAAAPEQMLGWHDQLKSLRKEQKSLQFQHETDQETLTNQKGRQENLRADVERLKERAEIQERIALLKKTVPFVEYATARKHFLGHKERRQEAQKRLKELEKNVEPTLRAVNAKQQYQSLIEVVINDRKADLEDAERAAEGALRKIEELESSITEVSQERKAEKEGDRKRKQDQQRIQAKIKELESQLQHPPPPFDSEDWNSRIRAKEHRARHVNTELRIVNEQINELYKRGQAKKQEIKEAEQELQHLNSQVGQQVNKLRRFSEDTARAWDWIQKNMDQFEKPIYGPPMIVCSIKDPRYTDLMEALFQKSDLLTITTQTKSDFKKLGDQAYGTMGLADVNIKCQSRDLAQEMQRRPNISEQQLKQFGLDGWASDFLDGPEPVVAMLCSTANLHSTGIALEDITESQYSVISESRIGAWASGKHAYRITRRMEYGVGAVSTISRNVQQARLWSDQPVDMSAKREIDDRIQTLIQEHRDMGAEVGPLREKKAELTSERTQLDNEIANLKREKNGRQTEAGQHAALPNKIARETESLKQKEKEGRLVQERFAKFLIKENDLVLKKTALALDHKNRVDRLRDCHESCLEAELRLAEAKSDVEALGERNQGNAQKLEDERQIVAGAQREEKSAKESAQKALVVCQEILAEERDGGQTQEYFSNAATNLTMEALQNDIQAEESKLEFVHGGNSGALKEFESREVTIQKLKDKIADTGRKLEKLNRKISEVRQQWEPELDKLVKEISDAFAYNFEQIGCAGEVGVHKDDDFDLWSIEIKVKFRENETLQLLDQHRQSGGERSVSTIFYLMSLQSLARAPFRVVDEINQGMDPRNERMVHERMVEIACKEHTSQYFLITPKLLTGLKYDPRMKVLCIASGEYMPEDHSLLDVRRAIKLKRAAIAAAS